MAPRLRLADLLAGLSMVADLGYGFPTGQAMRSCTVGVALARKLGVADDAVTDTLYTSLLLHVGCVGFSHEMWAHFGDEYVANRAGEQTNFADPRDILGTLIPSSTRHLRPAARLKAATFIVTRGRALGQRYDTTVCEVGRETARRIGLPDGVSVMCLLAGMLLLVPAVMGLARVVPTAHRPAVGQRLAAAGFMLFAVASGALGVGPSAWAAVDDGDRGALVAAFEAMDGGKGAMPIVQWGPILALLGLVVFAVVLWRHSGYPRWAVLALPLGWAIFLFTPLHVTRAAGALVLLVGFSVSAVATTREVRRLRPRVEPQRVRTPAV